MERGAGWFFPAGLLGLGCTALLELLHGSLSGLEVPLIAGALLAIGEFGYWSLELQATVRRQDAAIARRLGIELSATIAGLVISGVYAGLAGLVH
jgi:hypothetical protein